MPVRISAVFGILGFCVIAGIRLFTTMFPKIIPSAETAQLVVLATAGGHACLVIAFLGFRRYFHSHRIHAMILACSIAVIGEMLAVLIRLEEFLRIREIVPVDQETLMIRLESFGLMLSAIALWFFFLILQRTRTPDVPGSAGAFRGMTFFVILQAVTFALKFVRPIPLVKGGNLLMPVVIGIAILAILAMIRLFAILWIRGGGLIPAAHPDAK